MVLVLAGDDWVACDDFFCLNLVGFWTGEECLGVVLFELEDFGDFLTSSSTVCRLTFVFLGEIS